MARPKKQVNPDNFYSIYNWMLTDFGLSKTKLLVYAFIYAYSINTGGKGCYFGGYEAMSLSVGCSTKNLQTITQELCDIGLIEKQQVELENGLQRNYFRVSIEPLEKIAPYTQSVTDRLEDLHSFDPVWNDLEKICKGTVGSKKNHPKIF